MEKEYNEWYILYNGVISMSIGFFKSLIIEIIKYIKKIYVYKKARNRLNDALDTMGETNKKDKYALRKDILEYKKSARTHLNVTGEINKAIEDLQNFKNVLYNEFEKEYIQEKDKLRNKVSNRVDDIQRHIKKLKKFETNNGNHIYKHISKTEMEIFDELLETSKELVKPL